MFRALTLAILVGGIVYTWENWEIIPCQEPISYNIGSFDRRFDITQAQFTKALGEAEAIWEGPLGRDLLAYDPHEGKLKVNLLYDYRQETTEELNQLERQIKFDEREYKALENELKAMRNDPNVDVALYNEKVDRLNTLAREHNIRAERYNRLGEARGETFAGGLYVSDETGESINIYEFENNEKLVRVLAHEFGHALGLEHIEDPEAIMYKLNQGDAEKLTSTDLQALKVLCQSNP